MYPPIITRRRLLPPQPSPFLHLLSCPFRQSHPRTPGSSHPLPPTHFLSVARWRDWLNCRKGEDSVTPNRVVDRLLSRSPPGNVRQRVVPGAASPGQLNSARQAVGGLRGCLRPLGRGSYTSAGPTLPKGHQQSESGGPAAWSQPPTAARHRAALLSVTEPSSGCGSWALSTPGGGGSAT